MSEMNASRPGQAGTAPARLSPEEARRRRGRNTAMALGLIAWVVLIFVITIVKMKGG